MTGKLTWKIPLIFLCWLGSASSFGQEGKKDADREMEVETILLPKPKGEVATADLAALKDQIGRQINHFRQQKDLGALKTDRELADTAQAFAEFMARTDKYGHTADGRHPAERAKKQGYGYCIVSENIGYAHSSHGFKTEELVRRFVDGWKNSTVHRNNMLDSEITEAGVGAAISETTGVYFAVHMFGRPWAARIRFEVTNHSEKDAEYTLDGRDIPLAPGSTIKHERCRPAELVFRWAGDKKTYPVTARPSSGDLLIVQLGNAGELNLVRSRSEEDGG